LHPPIFILIFYHQFFATWNELIQNAKRAQAKRIWDLLTGEVREKLKITAWIGGARPSDVETAQRHDWHKNLQLSK